MTIRRRMVTAAACGTCVLAWATARVRADLPQSVRENPQAQNDAPAIAKWVNDTLSRVKPGDTRFVQSREELCRQAETGVVQPSASFQNVYVQAVVASVQPILKNPDAVLRLNAAIIVTRQSTAAPQLGTTLQPVTLALLKDDSPAVVLWGLKSAQAILPQMLSVPLIAKQQKLTPAVVAALAKHHTVDAIVQQAYDALTLPDAPPAGKGALAVTAAAMADILDLRIAEYRVGVPVNPRADGVPLVYFIKGAVVNDQTPAQRLRVLQSVSNLLTAAAQRLDTAGPAKDDVFGTVTNAAGAMYSIMSAAGNADAAAKYQAFLKMRPGLNPPAQIIEQARLALADVRKTTDYAAIKDAPAPAPATGNAAPAKPAPGNTAPSNAVPSNTAPSNTAPAK